MGVRVIMHGEEDDVYDLATDWFADSDGTLQVYQTVGGQQRAVAEYAQHVWVKAKLDPMPGPDNNEENSSK